MVYFVTNCVMICVKKGSDTILLYGGLCQRERFFTSSIISLRFGHSLKEGRRPLLNVKYVAHTSVITKPSFPGLVTISWDCTKCFWFFDVLSTSITSIDLFLFPDGLNLAQDSIVSCCCHVISLCSCIACFLLDTDTCKISMNILLHRLAWCS